MIHWIIQYVVLLQQWWNKLLPCFLIGMWISCSSTLNATTLLCDFSFLQTSENSEPNLIQIDEPCQNESTHGHKILLLGKSIELSSIETFLPKSHYLYHIICHVNSPCIFSAFQSKWKTITWNGRTFDMSILMFFCIYVFPLWVYVILLKWTWSRGGLGSSYLNTWFFHAI